MSKKLKRVKGIIHNLLASLSGYSGVPITTGIQKGGEGTYEIDILAQRIDKTEPKSADAKKQLNYFHKWFIDKLIKLKLIKSDFSE